MWTNHVELLVSLSFLSQRQALNAVWNREGSRLIEHRVQIFRPTQIQCSIENYPQRTSTTTVLTMLLRYVRTVLFAVQGAIAAKSGQQKQQKHVESQIAQKKRRRKRSFFFQNLFEFDVFFVISKDSGLKELQKWAFSAKKLVKAQTPRIHTMKHKSLHRRKKLSLKMVALSLAACHSEKTTGMMVWRINNHQNTQNTHENPSHKMS